MKNGEIWKESSKTYHLLWLSLVTGEFNVVHCYAEKVSTDEADVKPCTTAARARDQASACCALWRPFPVLLRTDICFALENRWSIVSFAEPDSCYQPQWRKRRKRKKPFCEAYCDNPSTSSCHTVIWCPIPGLSSDPKLLQQVVWAGCSDQSGWWERHCSRTARNKILSKAACAAYEPETAPQPRTTPQPARLVFAGDTHVVETFTLLMEHIRHTGVAGRPSTSPVSSSKPMSVCEFKEAAIKL